MIHQEFIHLPRELANQIYTALRGPDAGMGEDPSELAHALAECLAAEPKQEAFGGEFPLVVVEWEDATNVAEWTEREEAAKFDRFEFDFLCTNVGYLIRNDDECVIVAARATGDLKNVGLFERIPRGMVRSVRSLVPEEAVQ